MPIAAAGATLAIAEQMLGTPQFTVPLVLALEYAERITYTDQKVDDALFAKVKQHFTEPQIVELTAAIAFENFRSKFNPPLGIEAQGFCMVPKR